MIKVLLFDFARVILFPNTGESIDLLNGHYTQLKKDNGSYNPLDTFILNQELLDYIEKKNNSGFTSYIFTSGYIHTDPELGEIINKYFKISFTTTQIGLPKSFPKSFEIVAKYLEVNTNEIIFIDDQLKNVEAANNAGVKGVQFTNNDETIASIKELIKHH